MSNEITTNKSPLDGFQDRVRDKLKADIGSMLPDDVLSQLTQRAVDEQFFKERREARQFGPDVIKPSWFVEEVARVSKSILEAHIETFVAENKDAIQKGLDEYLSQQNLTLLTSAAIAAQMQGAMYQNVDQIVQTILNAPRY